VNRLIQAAAERGMKYLFGMGLFSRGYDQIIRADPAVRGKNKSGQPLDHVMCGATEKAWSYVEKFLDTALSNFDFGGVHLESADLGWCDCTACGGKYGPVGYNVRLNSRAADYIKRKWPDKIVTCIPINWLGGSGRSHFDQAEQDQIIELSKHIDCFMDQDWTGTFIADEERRAFIQKLHCDYGTSFGRWDSKRFAAVGRPMPGELHLTDLFGTSPGPALFLLEPFLNAEGRQAYKKRLVAILQDLANLEGSFDDGGRLTRIQKSITVMLIVQ
jgi:hypothetical protein